MFTLHSPHQTNQIYIQNGKKWKEITKPSSKLSSTPRHVATHVHSCPQFASHTLGLHLGLTCQSLTSLPGTLTPQCPTMVLWGLGLNTRCVGLWMCGCAIKGFSRLALMHGLAVQEHFFKQNRMWPGFSFTEKFWNEIFQYWYNMIIPIAPNSTIGTKVQYKGFLYSLWGSDWMFS